MKTTIYPTERIPDGTEVTIINKGRATIVSSSEERDNFNLPIIVHTVRYPSGKVSPVNYSFIVRPT